MALPINIESLLSGSAVESNQLEFKEGWNPDAIYRSVCAFANGFEDTGGGYIIVGVKEEHGRAVRPELGALNFGGPNHTISSEAIREARMLRSRRYNNRRLGEFLKELNLTEGRATGIPTIQQKLQENGSPRATIETDEERTFFLIDIPCNQYCLGVPVIKDDKKDDKKGDKKELTDIQRVLISFISENDKITISEMARKTALSESTISREIKRLRVDHKILNREGGRKNGHWVIIK